MAQGNPNPDMSGLTPFKPGHPGNPGGKTSEQKRREMANAELATKLRGRMLEALERRLDDALKEEGDNAIDAAAVNAIQGDILKLLKDSEDRGLGAPTQPVSGPDGGNFITEIRSVIVRPTNDDA